MGYNDLINITFEDAVLHTTTDTSDILGVIMPYFWGPAGEVNVFNQQEFFETYPEFKRSDVTMTNVTNTYAQIKSYFNNGGSRVAVYRPVDTYYGFVSLGGSSYVRFKYPGLPPIAGTLALALTNVSGDDYTATFTVDGSIVETFTGDLANPSAVDPDTGETKYLPKILENKSQYMSITSTQPTPIGAYIPAAAQPQDITNAFGNGDTLIPTQFIEYNQTIDGFNSSVAFVNSSSNAASKFVIKVAGTESIKVFGSNVVIDCNAGVAGAYAKVASKVHLNQIASARTYGQYIGTLTSIFTFQNAVSGMETGLVTVFNSSTGPQIFGTNNAFYTAHKGSYFGKCNVSRVLASILKNIIPNCIDAIHTDTAANAITRKVFESNLNSIIGSFIATQDLQSDSIAICNASNNSDAQTQGGKILNILLSLHFIGLVEKVNIKVVATDSSVTVSYI